MQVIEFMQAGSLSSQQKILTERKKIYFGNKLNAMTIMYIYQTI